MTFVQPYRESRVSVWREQEISRRSVWETESVDRDAGSAKFSRVAKVALLKHKGILTVANSGEASSSETLWRSV